MLTNIPVLVVARFGQHYDLSRYIDKSVIDASDISAWPGDEPSGIGRYHWRSVLLHKRRNHINRLRRIVVMIAYDILLPNTTF